MGNQEALRDAGGSGTREEAPEITPNSLPESTGREGSPIRDLPARWQQRTVMFLQVLPSEGLDVGVDAADLGALGLLQLPLQLLPVRILHGFDGCEGQHSVSTPHPWVGF